MLVRSNAGLCGLLAPQVLRNVFSQAGEPGRAKCRAAAVHLRQAPIVKFRVVAVDGGRARAGFTTTTGFSGVMTLERVNGRWIITSLPVYGGE